MALTPVQKDILIDLLLHGDDKAQNVANRTNHHRNNVSSHMGTLVDEGKLTGKGGGVYRLREPGRDVALGLIKSGYNPYIDD